MTETYVYIIDRLTTHTEAFVVLLPHISTL